MPSYGAAMREHWTLEPDSVYLNHGTVGATPRRVQQAQQALRDEMERHPSRFILRELAGWSSQDLVETLPARFVGRFELLRTERWL